MAVVDLFGAVGGRPEIDPNAASRGYELGTKAGAMSGQTGRLAFLNEMINKRDQRRATEASMAQEQTKARVAKIQDILIRGADPNANPVDRAAAEKIKVMLDSNPQMAQVIGIDPNKTGSTTSSLDYIKALTNTAGGEGFVPGTKANVKTPFGTMSIPMNREFTEGEAGVVAGAQSLENTVTEITDMLNNGVLGKGDFVRTARQGIADSTNALLSSKDPKLQAFQQALNTLKKTLPFTEGGKQLTPFEAKRVFALLNVTGKTDEQIIKDINNALDIVRRKGSLIVGGQNTIGENGASQNINSSPSTKNAFSNLSDEELSNMLNELEKNK